MAYCHVSSSLPLCISLLVCGFREVYKYSVKSATNCLKNVLQIYFGKVLGNMISESLINVTLFE